MRRSASLLLLTLGLGVLEAQSVRVARTADLRTAPGGRAVGSLQSGTTWRPAGRRDGAVSITLEGWIESARVAGRRDSFPQTVSTGASVQVRAGAQPGARVLGALVGGAGIRVLERRGAWSRVRRTGWVDAGAFGTAAASASPATRPGPASPAPEAGPSSAAADAVTARERLALRPAPGEAGGAPVGEVAAGTRLTPVGRDRGWVKVMMEGWVQEVDVAPADTAFRADLRAADLRLDPARNRGRVVRWDVQAIGLQRADPLRRGLEPDEPYLLALGPTGENTVLYLAVPAALLNAAQGLPPMADLRITARVRVGRSEPTGAPILDLLTLTRR